MLRFFNAHSKAELHEGALKHRVMLYPVDTTADLLGNPQLAARGFWTELDHPELNGAITYPGAFARSSGTPIGPTHRAPGIGEHNSDVYEKELGMSRAELTMLKQAGVI